MSFLLDRSLVYISSLTKSWLSDFSHNGTPSGIFGRPPFPIPWVFNSRAPPHSCLCDKWWCGVFLFRSHQFLIIYGYVLQLLLEREYLERDRDYAQQWANDDDDINKNSLWYAMYQTPKVLESNNISRMCHGVSLMWLKLDRLLKV